MIQELQRIRLCKTLRYFSTPKLKVRVGLLSSHGHRSYPSVVILGLAETSIDTIDRQVNIISSSYLLPSIRYLRSLRDQRNVTSKINDYSIGKELQITTST